MRNQRARRNTPTVIIQQPPYQAVPPVEVIERQPIDQQTIMIHLAQMIAQQQTQPIKLEPQTLDVKEAAEYLRMSPWTVRDMVRTKSIPFFRIRSRIFFRRPDLDSWISSRVNSCTREG
ncbi:Helix-turn-helix domain protein [compost metagenome]